MPKGGRNNLPRNLTALSLGSLPESEPAEHVRFLGGGRGKGEEGQG